MVALMVFDFAGGSKALREFIHSERVRSSSEIGAGFGRLSVQGVNYAQTIADIFDSYMAENDILPSEFASHPELMEGMIGESMQTMLAVMERNTCSGVFIMLDCPVSYELERAEYLKAGMFLKKTVVNQTGAVDGKVFCLRGSANVAREYGIELLGQWRMQFDIERQFFFKKNLQRAAENPNMPLSRLYCWSTCMTLKGNSEASFLLCIPIRGEDGTIYGLCGLEVSDRLFKRLYSPDNSSYASAFCGMAPYYGEEFHIENGMIAGNYYLTGESLDSPLTMDDQTMGFELFSSKDGSFGGAISSLKLYPSDSPYITELWCTGIFMDEASLVSAARGDNYVLIGIGVGVILLGLAASVFISRRYLKPVVQGIDTIKSGEYSANRYLEINDLMEYLSKRESKESDIPAAELAPMFGEFMKNMQTLSPAERNVFNMYIEGYTAKEISEKLYLSKTQSKRTTAGFLIS